MATYEHSVAAPHQHCQDEVLVVVELLAALEQFWLEQKAAGEPDTMFTVGKLFTNAAQHAITKVPGECSLTINVGGTTRPFLRGRNRSSMHWLVRLPLNGVYLLNSAIVRALIRHPWMRLCAVY